MKFPSTLLGDERQILINENGAKPGGSNIIYIYIVVPKWMQLPILKLPDYAELVK